MTDTDFLIDAGSLCSHTDYYDFYGIYEDSSYGSLLLICQLKDWSIQQFVQITNVLEAALVIKVSAVRVYLYVKEGKQ